MGLIDTVSKWLGQFRSTDDETTSDDKTDGGPLRYSPPSSSNLFRLAKLKRDRRSEVLSSRDMYDNDPRAEGIISTLARDATKGGFDIVITEAADEEAAKEIATDLKDRLRLVRRLDDWTRLTLRDGDSFLECSIDADFLVQMVTRKPTLLTYRNSNRYDTFSDPEHAYWIEHGAAALSTSIPGLNDPGVTWLADWQAIHARWNHDEGRRYGRPLFASARRQYTRMTQGEHDMYVRRRTRAGMKFVHVVEGDETDIDEYRRLNQDTLNNPFSAIADYFTNAETNIKTVQGDATLSEIRDVLHHIETWAMASPVPLTLLGYGQDINRDILKEKMIQYERALEPISDWISDQILTPLFELQWMLQGIWPGDMEYRFVWASKKVLTAEALALVGEAGLKLRALGWSDEIIASIIVPLIPGLSIDEVLAAIEQSQAESPDEINRIADLANEAAYSAVRMAARAGANGGI